LHFLGKFIILTGLSAVLCTASMIPVNFKNAETPPGPTTVTLPYLLSLGDDTLFLRFKIPNISTVASVNSMNITVTLYDDGDRGAESGRIQFALPSGPNMDLGSYSAALDQTTSSAPLILSYTLDPSQIAQVFPTIQDGNFRIKVLRDTGDFYVAGGTVTIDASIPEPASILTGATGLLLLASIVRRRNRKCAPNDR
jgi:hypothetical protein